MRTDYTNTANCKTVLRLPANTVHV